MKVFADQMTRYQKDSTTKNKGPNIPDCANRKILDACDNKTNVNIKIRQSYYIDGRSIK